MQFIRLGKIIDGDAARDAVHIAVAPVIAGESLVPGEHVVLDISGRAVHSSAASSIGIVDPFLGGLLQRGQRFWLFMNPGSTEQLRHDWAHIAFDKFDKATNPKVVVDQEYARRLSHDEGEENPYDDYRIYDEEGKCSC